MDAFEWNKVLGAVLGTVLFLFVLRLVAESVFHEEPLEEMAYKIDTGAMAVATNSAPVEEKPVDLGLLLSGASATAGERVAARCLSCHNFEKGGANGTGPNLWGIMGAKVAHRDDFNYSKAMASFGGEWTYERMFGYLENPKAYLPGTNMAFAGLKREKDRANIIAYMRTQADSSPPLPKPLAAAEEAEEEADAEDATEEAANGTP